MFIFVKLTVLDTSPNSRRYRHPIPVRVHRSVKANTIRKRSFSINPAKIIPMIAHVTAKISSEYVSSPGVVALVPSGKLKHPSKIKYAIERIQKVLFLVLIRDRYSFMKFLLASVPMPSLNLQHTWPVVSLNTCRQMASLLFF